MPITDYRLARRDFVAGLALFAAAAPSLAQAAQTSHRKQATSPHHLLLREVSQLVIPRSTTAGAGEVGVGAFVLLGLAHGLAGSHEPLPATLPEGVAAHVGADGRLDYVGWLKAALDQAAGSPFMAQPPARRHAVLAALDAQAYDPKAGWHPWKAIKKLILTGYYTSEVGGAKELNYVHVPGRFDPDLPLKPSDRAYSSDWTGVDFG
jgi:hypothetical protein